jgi:hypothetical protein
LADDCSRQPTRQELPPDPLLELREDGLARREVGRLSWRPLSLLVASRRAFLMMKTCYKGYRLTDFQGRSQPQGVSDRESRPGYPFENRNDFEKT